MAHHSWTLRLPETFAYHKRSFTLGITDASTQSEVRLNGHVSFTSCTGSRKCIWSVRPFQQYFCNPSPPLHIPASYESWMRITPWCWVLLYDFRSREHDVSIHGLQVSARGALYPEALDVRWRERLLGQQRRAQLPW